MPARHRGVDHHDLGCSRPADDGRRGEQLGHAPGVGPADDGDAADTPPRRRGLGVASDLRPVGDHVEGGGIGGDRSTVDGGRVGRQREDPQHVAHRRRGGGVDLEVHPPPRRTRLVVDEHPHKHPTENT